MSNNNKDHYRKVFKSDHLGVADLEDFIEEGNKNLIFTIKNVRQENGVMVAGRKGNYNIAYFKEKIKPLVLNATNSKVVKSFNDGSPFVQDWNDTIIQLYIDSNVKMKGEIVGGVRIKKDQPTQSNQEELEKIRIIINEYTDAEALKTEMEVIYKDGMLKGCVKRDIQQIGLDKFKELSK